MTLERRGLLLALLAGAASGPDAPALERLQGAPVRAEVVRLTTSDGGTVIADRYGAGPRAVVLVHGGRFTRSAWRPLATVLATSGWQVLAIDLRGYGDSKLARPAEVGQREEALDVLSAVAEMRRAGAQEVCVVGASLGGGAAGAAAADTSVTAAAISCLVLLAPTVVPDLGPKGPRQTVLLGALDSTASGALRITALWEQYRRGGRRGCFRTFDSHAHAQELLLGADSARVTRAIINALAGGDGC